MMRRSSDVGWIERGLKRPGKSKAGLAEALGRHPSVATRILKGDRPLKDYEIALIENYLGAPRATPGLGERAQMFDDRMPLAPSSSPRGNVYLLKPRLGAFSLDLGADPVQIDPKPPKHANVRGLFGVMLGGESMAPRFDVGEIAWVHPDLPARPGDDVLFLELGGGEAEAHVGRLIAATTTVWRARTFTPPEEFSVRRDRFRIMRLLARD